MAALSKNRTATSSGTQFQAGDYLKRAGATATTIAAQALARLPLHIYNASNVHILDSACGPGIVTALLLSSQPHNSTDTGIVVPGLPLRPAPRITGIDLAPSMIETYKSRAAALGWATADAFVHDAGDLSCFADGTFDAVVMSLGIFMVNDPTTAAREMHRVLKPGGHVLVTSWKRAGVHYLLQKVIDAIRPPGRRTNVSPISAKWTQRETLARVMREGDFVVEEGDGLYEASARWEPVSLEEMIGFLGSASWMDRLCVGWTEEEKGRWNAEIVKQLDEDERDTASVSMVAWVFVGKKE